MSHIRTVSRGARPVSADLYSALDLLNAVSNTVANVLGAITVLGDFLVFMEKHFD